MNNRTPRRSRAFTLTEVMVASVLLTIVVGITLVCFITILKQNHLTGETSTVSLELQRATRRISTVIQSSPAAPIILNASGAEVAIASDSTAQGLAVRLAPPANHYVMVTGGTDILDAATNTLGYNKTRKVITISGSSPQAATTPMLQPGAECPDESITTIDSAIFVTTAPSIDLPSLFSAGDEVAIPLTGYGDGRQLTVKTVSSSTLTFTNALGAGLPSASTWALPNGTLIVNSAGPRARFTVVASASGVLRPGDLIYHSDDSVPGKYSVIARNIDPTPRAVPGSASSFNEGPFIYNSQTLEVIVNLQCLPAGNPVAGRATIGTRTRVKVRTNPNPNNI